MSLRLLLVAIVLGLSGDAYAGAGSVFGDRTHMALRPLQATMVEDLTRSLQWPSSEQVSRVVFLWDYNTRVVLLGTMLLGATAGLVGGFTATMNWGVIRSGTHTVRMEVHFQPRGTVVQTNTITVLRPADRAFIPNLDLTTAEVSLVGDTVIIDGIYVPSDANGAITEKEDVHVGLRWNSATQSFGIVETN